MTQTNSLRGQRVLFFQQRNWGKNIGRFLARQLYGEGCRLAALTSKFTTHRTILNQTDVIYDLIESHDQILTDPKKYLGDYKVTLEEINLFLGVDSIWPILSASRMLNRSYEKKYYYSFKKNVSDEYFVDYVKALWKCAERIFTEFKPDIIIAPNFASGHHVFFYLYAKKLGVKMLTITDTKVRGILTFSESPDDNAGHFFEYLDQLNRGDISLTANEREKARKYITEFRAQFKKPSYAFTETKLTWWHKLRSELSPWKRVFMWYIKKPANFIPPIGPSIDYQPPHIVLRDHFAAKKNRREVAAFPYCDIEKVGRFAYLPLQFQPEAAIDVVAPHFSNQIEVARQVAMSLPCDYTLVVKDTPIMSAEGLRSRSYLEKVAGLANVKLIHHKTPTEKILRRAHLVIGVSGTTFAEAAFYRKPVIQFGGLGTTLRLPNVFRHTNFTTLTQKINDVLKQNFDTSEFEKRLENFVGAALKIGFDLDYHGIWQEGKRDKMFNLWEIYRSEIIKRVHK